jgi:hypothetical protein
MDYGALFCLADILPSSYSLPVILQQAGDSGLGDIGQKSAVNWLINTGFQQTNVYQVKDEITGENRSYERLIACLGNGRYVMVRADELESWCRHNIGPCPPLEVSGEAAGSLKFVLRQWIEISNEQNRFRKLLEKSPSWHLFLQRAKDFNIPRREDSWVTLTPEQEKEVLLRYLLTTVGITGTPSVIGYAQEQLKGKEPDECTILPMRGALVTSFLITYGLSVGTQTYTHPDGRQEEYDGRLAQVHQEVHFASQMIQPYLLRSIQSVFSLHYKWFSTNLKRLVTARHVLISGNLQRAAPGRPRETPWDDWVNMYISSPKRLTHTTLLAKCKASELERLQEKNPAKTTLTPEEVEKVQDRLRKRIARLQTLKSE